jgi:hypothetical protein
MQLVAQSYEQNLSRLVDHVNSNTSLQGAYWLEMQNAFGEWEKMMLIFGYADPGDQAACEAVTTLTRKQNPTGKYRCNPVN